MYTTLRKTVRNRYLQPSDQTRDMELAQALVHAFGYEEAVEKAKQSHWDQVADTIRFLKGQSLRRF